MLHNFSEYVSLLKEGAVGSPTVIYWTSQLEEILDKDWYDIQVQKLSGKNFIKFRTSDKDEKYNYYQVITELKGVDDFYYMQNSEPFFEKFKNEFWKNPQEYIKNMKYHPKCLGDLSHIKMAGKFNM